VFRVSLPNSVIIYTYASESFINYAKCQFNGCTPLNSPRKQYYRIAISRVSWLMILDTSQRIVRFCEPKTASLVTETRANNHAYSRNAASRSHKPHFPPYVIGLATVNFLSGFQFVCLLLTVWDIVRDTWHLKCAFHTLRVYFLKKYKVKMWTIFFTIYLRFIYLDN